MAINKKHTDFIQQIAKGVQQEVAYRTTIGNKDTTSQSARSQGSKLCKKYAKEITEAKQKAQKVVEQANYSQDAKNALKQVLTQAQVDAKLCEIITGEATVEKIIVVAGKVQVIKSCKPDHSDKLKAIDLYNKRFGSNAPTSTNISITDLPSPSIVLKK